MLCCLLFFLWVLCWFDLGFILGVVCILFVLYFASIFGFHSVSVCFLWFYGGFIRSVFRFDVFVYLASILLLFGFYLVLYFGSYAGYALSMLGFICVLCVVL